jgi:molybdopterin synthase sulfur carrier subunit
MITINIKLIGLFQTGRFKLEEQGYPTGTTVGDVVKKLQLPEQHFGIILINGVHAKPETVLTNGDSLTLLPIIDGG